MDRSLLALNDREIRIARGLYKGSCGAPYVTMDGEVIAIHLGSINEALCLTSEEDKDHDSVSEAHNSVADSHNSMSYGSSLILDEFRSHLS